MNSMSISSWPSPSPDDR
uniref:Xth1 n=1 Tax=Arundo donax TaxID=35708 RepID=A0A0A9A3K0_ARUDO